jgi:hypothetical protein
MCTHLFCTFLTRPVDRTPRRRTISIAAPPVLTRAFVQSGFNEVAFITATLGTSLPRDLTEASRFTNRKL